jgi:hypothetical protein
MSTNNAIVKEANLAGWQPLPNRFYEVSAAQIKKHLEEDILGFRIGCDWERWTGTNIFMGYLRMRVVMSPKDIECSNYSAPNDYAHRTLESISNAGRIPDENIINSLKPFMYPQDMRKYLNNAAQDEIAHMNNIGINGRKLDELIEYSKLSFVKDENTGKEYYRVYLRPERILMHGLKRTDGPNGKIYIRRIYGTDDANFRLLAERVLTASSITDDLSIDQIFNLR